MLYNIVLRANGQVLGRDYGVCPVGRAHQFTFTVKYRDTLPPGRAAISSFVRRLKQLYPHTTPNTLIHIWKITMLQDRLIETVNSTRNRQSTFQVVWDGYCQCIDYLEGIYAGRD